MQWNVMESWNHGIMESWNLDLHNLHRLDK
jgi:hypothetical protein